MPIESNRYARRGFLSRVAALPVIAAIVARWQPSASFGQIAPGDPLVVPRLPEAELAREVESLMKLVDPRVAYHHTPIAPERNAWPLWKQAAETIVKKSGDDEYEEAVGEFLENGQRPSEAILARMTEWTRRNEPARRLTDEGIARGTFELPRATESIRLSLPSDEYLTLRNLAQLKETVSRLQLLNGEVAEALREAESIVLMGRMLLGAECLFVDHLVAQIILGMGASSVQRAALHQQAKRDDARRAVSSLSISSRDHDSFRDSLRVELCRWFLPKIANVPKTSDPLALAMYMAFSDCTPDFAPSERQRAEYVRSVHDTARLIADHPSLFDQEATVRQANELHVRLFDELAKPFHERNRRIFDAFRAELSAWPAFVEPNLSIIYELDDSDQATELTSRKFAKARRDLRRVENLVGKRLLANEFSARWNRGMELCHVRMTAMQLRIALSHHERQYGSLPQRLEELVSDRWFPAVPLDPYDRQPFRYSAADRIVWSVGRDGTGDGPSKLRDESFDPEWEHLDNVWSIPGIPTG